MNDGSIILTLKTECSVGMMMMKDLRGILTNFTSKSDKYTEKNVQHLNELDIILNVMFYLSVLHNSISKYVVSSSCLAFDIINGTGQLRLDSF